MVTTPPSVEGSLCRSLAWRHWKIHSPLPTFCCRQRHHGLSQNRIELVEDGFAPPGGNIARNTGDGSGWYPGLRAACNGLGHLLCVRTVNVVLIHVLRLDRLTVDLRIEYFLRTPMVDQGRKRVKASDYFQPGGNRVGCERGRWSCGTNQAGGARRLALPRHVAGDLRCVPTACSRDTVPRYESFQWGSARWRLSGCSERITAVREPQDRSSRCKWRLREEGFDRSAFRRRGMRPLLQRAHARSRRLFLPACRRIPHGEKWSRSLNWGPTGRLDWRRALPKDPRPDDRALLGYGIAYFLAEKGPVESVDTLLHDQRGITAGLAGVQRLVEQGWTERSSTRSSGPNHLIAERLESRQVGRSVIGDWGFGTKIGPVVRAIRHPMAMHGRCDEAIWAQDWMAARGVSVSESACSVAAVWAGRRTPSFC